jgi:hypothetical protein
MPKLVTGLCLALFFVLAARPAGAAEDPGDALRRAASAGDLAKVKELLAAGVDVNAANAYGGTALAFAADKGHAAVVDLLLERGADINAKDRFYGSTPLAWAVRHGHTGIVRTLLAKGAQGETEALIRAATEGRGAVVKVILERGKVGAEALTDTLEAATQNQQPEMVALLQAAGAKPPVAVDLDPAVLKTYEGIFEGTYNGEAFDLTIAVKDGKLIMTIPEDGDFTFVATAPVTFRAVEVPGLKVVFQVEEGKVRGLSIRERGTSTPLTKRETP